MQLDFWRATGHENSVCAASTAISTNVPDIILQKLAATVAIMTVSIRRRVR